MKITVITVSYNAATTIADTLCSVASQTHTDIEHLVFDGQSTDNTVQVVEANWHSDLVFVSEPDKGIYDAMNKGLSHATGEVIGFLNADDLYADDDVVARVARTFEDNPNVEACFGDLLYVTKDNQSVVRFWKSKPFLTGSFARGWAPAHPTFYIRRSALSRLGGFDITYHLASDTEMMMRYLEKGMVRSAYIPQVQVRMRVGGVTNRNLGNIFRQNQEILKAFKKNDVPYSLILYLLYKLASRFWQRLAALRFEVSA